MPRDLFDTIRLPGYTANMWAGRRLRRIHVALGVALSLPLYLYGRNRLERVTDRSIEEQLAPVIQGDEQPLASKLKEQAWSVMEPLVTLDDAERQYVERVHVGELLPALLFPGDQELADRLVRRPVLLWEIETVRRHLSR